MPGINKVILIGNLGSNPELKYSSKGNPIAVFSIATSETWKDKSGQKQEKTEWHKILVFGKLAEVISTQFKKGLKVYIEGRLRTRNWKKDNQNYYSTEIIISGYDGILQSLDTD
ncbi:MAG: single-stranded DNA-binding protein [Candidatus Thioglobus sp.]|jgi:single-strand DNA-binding protein|nr:single-stranded DNA-binding protein [Candidatus Thioglobus sp.]